MIPVLGGQRSDADIFADARLALDRQPNVPSTVRIHVEHGNVTLTGTVRRVAERNEAEDAVRGVPGVVRLVNDIAIAWMPSAEGFEAPDESA
jgi:osmotically-inducible protein OsmY